MTCLLIYCLACHMPVLKKWDAIIILETDCKPCSCCNTVNPTLYCSWLQDHKNKSPKAPSTYSTFSTVMFLTSLEAVLSVLCALVQGFGSMALVLVFVLQLVCGRTVTYLLDVGSQHRITCQTMNKDSIPNMFRISVMLDNTGVKGTCLDSKAVAL